MKKTIIVLLLVMVVIGTAGCTLNEMGRFGPSWDVGIKVPIMDGQSKNVSQLLDNPPDEVVVPDPQADDNLVRLSTAFNDEDLPRINMVEDIIGEISFPAFTTDPVDLPELVVSIGDINYSGNTFTISSGINNLNFDNLDIGFPNFDSAEFAVDYSDNRLNVTVRNNSTGVRIDELILELKDTKQDTIIATAELTDIEPGEEGTASFNLQGKVLSDDTGLTGSITTSGDDSGEMSLDFSFPGEVKISSITNFTLPDGESINQSIDLGDISDKVDIPAGIKEITFASGSSLAVDVTGLPTGLSLSLNLGDLSDDNGDGIIELGPDNPLDVSNLSLSAAIESTGDSLNYEDNTITATGSFVNNGINNVRLDFSQELKNVIGYDDGLGGIPITETTVVDNLDLPDDISKIDLYQDANPAINLTVAGLDGLTLDLSNVSFKAYDSTGQAVMDDNGQPLAYNLKSVTGPSTDINLLEGNPGLLDLLLHPDTSEIRLGGHYDIMGNDVVVPGDHVIGLTSLEVDIPMSFEVKEDIEIAVEPILIEMEENLNQEELDMVKKGIKEASLVLEGLDNQLGLSLGLDVYLANIENGEQLTNEELKDELYVEDHLVENISFNNGFKDDLVITLTPDQAEVFTNEQVYFGALIRVPASEDPYELRTGNYVAMDQIYALIKVKINQ